MSTNRLIQSTRDSRSRQNSNLLTSKNKYNHNDNIIVKESIQLTTKRINSYSHVGLANTHAHDGTVMRSVSQIDKSISNHPPNLGAQFYHS